MKKEEKNKKENIEITLKFNKKNLLKGTGIFFVVLAVLGLAFAVSNTVDGKSNTFEFINITIDEYLTKLGESEKSIVYVARPTCSWCQKETPIIKSLGSKYGLKIYYLNTEEFYDSEINDYSESGYKFINAAEPYKSDQKFGTPNTIIIQNGEIVDGEYGYVAKDELEDFFERNGFIDE